MEINGPIQWKVHQQLLLRKMTSEIILQKRNLFKKSISVIKDEWI